MLASVDTQRLGVVAIVLCAVLVVATGMAHAVARSLAEPTYTECRAASAVSVLLSGLDDPTAPDDVRGCVGTQPSRLAVTASGTEVTATFRDLDRSTSEALRRRLVQPTGRATSFTNAELRDQLGLIDALDVWGRLSRPNFADPETARPAPVEDVVFSIDDAGHLRVRFHSPVPVDRDTLLHVSGQLAP